MQTEHIEIKTPSRVYTNQRIAVGKDLVFQWVLLTEDDEGRKQWLPIDQLEKGVLCFVRDNVLDPIFPDELREFVAGLNELPNRRVPGGM